MIGEERQVRRAHRHLDEGEAVITSLVGLEADGRRRRVVLVTERRVLVCWVRGTPPSELDLEGTHADHDAARGRLVLRDGAEEIELRDVDAGEVRVLVEVLADHRRGEATDEPPARGVRIVDR